MFSIASRVRKLTDFYNSIQLKIIQRTPEKSNGFSALRTKLFPDPPGRVPGFFKRFFRFVRILQNMEVILVENTPAPRYRHEWKHELDRQDLLTLRRRASTRRSSAETRRRASIQPSIPAEKRPMGARTGRAGAAVSAEAASTSAASSAAWAPAT
jgi:hypothetical protein